MFSSGKGFNLAQIPLLGENELLPLFDGCIHVSHTGNETVLLIKRTPMLIGVTFDSIFAYGVGLGGCVPVIPVLMNNHLKLRGCAEISSGIFLFNYFTSRLLTAYSGKLVIHAST